MPEESIIKHIYNFGDHRCKRGHSYRIHFEQTKEGVLSGYLKVCRRCGHDERRQLVNAGDHIEKVKTELPKPLGLDLRKRVSSQGNSEPPK